MTVYYLMVTEYTVGDRRVDWLLWKNGGPMPKSVVRYNLIKQIKTSSKKAHVAANAYAKELNGGRDKVQEEYVEKGTPYFTVIHIPYSDAREYRNFGEWSDCDVYSHNN